MSDWIRVTVGEDLDDGRVVWVDAKVCGGYPASFSDPGEGPSAEMVEAWWSHGARRGAALTQAQLDEVWPGWEGAAVAEAVAVWEDIEDQRAEMEREDMERWL